MTIHEAEKLAAQAREQQASELVAHIKKLESTIEDLEQEVDHLRSAGGVEEFRGLLNEALTRLVEVFDVVPIPDLSSWERGQALRRLGSAVAEIMAESNAGAGFDTEFQNMINFFC